MLCQAAVSGADQIRLGAGLGQKMNNNAMSCSKDWCQRCSALQGYPPGTRCKHIHVRSEPAPGRLRSRLEIPASPLGYVDFQLKYTVNLYKKGQTAMLCRAAVSGADQICLGAGLD
jgi:hypothetical protein